MKRGSILIFSGLILFFLLFGILPPTANAQTGSQSSPILKEGGVSPENDSWGSSFVFRVTYVGSENDFSLRDYPKLRLDGVEMVMGEEDPEDENFSDGKGFSVEWKPGPEDVGGHEFYFYIRGSSGDEIRYPENGNIEGPLVENKVTGVALELESEDQNLTFSGSLVGENEGLARENVVLYKVFKDENTPMGSAESDENGGFTISVSTPKGNGIFRYIAYFGGGEGYGESRSDSFYLNTLNAPLVIAVSSIFFLGVLAVIWFGLTHGFERSTYLMPVILGALIGMTLISILGVFGLLLGGMILGYLLAREVSGWSVQARIGAVAGTLGFSLYGFITLVNIFGFPESITFPYTIGQMAFLQNFLIGSLPTALIFVLVFLMGAILGEFFRKVLK